ncbi:MAG: ribosome biogenesis GTPase YlqF [Clostridiaceae bacterium]|jgi:ribosome biogenesis GTPase A|nr:ribosome biogenesis GTPase YlqF [Clostridiaceae bacterium]
MSEKGGCCLDINWFPGHMAKTLRELKAYLKMVDLVIETCDARIPESSRNPELQQLLGSKPRILVLNKADLADQTITGVWIDWYRQQAVTAIACNSLHKTGLKELEKACQDLMREKTERLMAKGRINVPIRGMVVGIPNTGKSTLINGLCRRKTAKTADRPGVTRQISWMKTSGRLELLDSPGILWPQLGDRHTKLLLAATGAIKDELLPVEDVAVALMDLLLKLVPDLVCQRYKLKKEDLSEPVVKILAQAARIRGCLLPGGRLDTLRFAALFIDELRAGKIGRITLEQPPEI